MSPDGAIFGHDQACVCYHCGESLVQTAETIVIDGQLRQVCCSGCAAAAQWINAAGLADYYRLRTADGARVGTQAIDYSAWDRPDVQHGHVQANGDQQQISIVVDGMHCAACAWLINQALQKENGVTEVNANSITGRVLISWLASQTRLSTILQRLASLGYHAHLASGRAIEEQRRKERNQLLLRLGVAGLGAMQAMMFAEALYLDSARSMPIATRDFFRWITFLVSTPVVFYSGWPFLQGFWRELNQRQCGMNTLIASGVLLAYGASLVETLRGGPDVWFDAAVMFVLFLLITRFFETMTRQHANAQLDALARAQPALAWRSRDGVREQVPIIELHQGDRLHISIGEAVPADGKLIGEAASFDESLLTGESAPVIKHDGDHVYAGSICRQSAASIIVNETGAGTWLSQLQRLVERAQLQRPRLAQIADTIAARFVVSLILIAAIVFVSWWQIDPDRAFAITLSVIVVSCPCALALAIPTALATAHAKLSKHGVTVVGDAALETLAKIDTVIFDKTGTLTSGRPQLVTIDTFAEEDSDEVLAIAGALERDSGHRLAAAFSSDAPLAAESVKASPGLGVEGYIGNHLYRLGRADFASCGIDDGAIWLTRDGFALARFVVDDAIRADAKIALADLQQLGLKIELLSGDNQDNVQALAEQLMIKNATARCSPEDKLQRARELQEQSRVVAMVGDGINDAAVLAGANVSIAMGSGAGLAQRHADLIIHADALLRIPQAIALARRSRSIIYQNLFWAIAYNLIAIPLAALGYVTPGLAALGMALSSLLVTANALRLTRDITTAKDI